MNWFLKLLRDGGEKLTNNILLNVTIILTGITCNKIPCVRFQLVGAEVVVCRCSSTSVLNNFAKFTRNTCVGVSFK